MARPGRLIRKEIELKHGSSSYVVIAEFGSDWAAHADACRERFDSVLILLQWSSESAQGFARRVAAKLGELGRVSGVSVVCTGRCDRSALAGRRILVDHSRAALAGVPYRELTLVCESHLPSEVPQWAASLVLNVEACDLGLDVSVLLNDRHVHAAVA